MKTREEIIAQMRRNLKEVRQIFTDCDHWNNRVRKPDEAIIDCDPDGQLRRIEQAYTSALAAEEKRLLSEPDKSPASPMPEEARAAIAGINSTMRQKHL